MAYWVPAQFIVYGLHWAVPGTELKKPNWHWVQAVLVEEPWLLFSVPAGHRRHEACLVMSLYSPRSQGRQLALGGVVECCPIKQSRQLLPDALACPLAHATHIPPAVLCWPAAHARHVPSAICS
jgi:hypothetical protein